MIKLSDIDYGFNEVEKLVKMFHTNKEHQTPLMKKHIKTCIFFTIHDIDGKLDKNNISETTRNELVEKKKYLETVEKTL